MMKQKTLMVLLMIVLALMMAGPALAQGIDQLPDSAGSGLAALLAGVGAILAGGSLGNALTETIKRIKLPFLGGDAEIKLGGLLAEAAALLISAGLGWLALNYLTPLAQWLDQSGLWGVAVAAYPVARAWFEIRKRRGG